MDLVYLNGALIPRAEATISAFDRGFIFGDGVYEVVPVYGGRPFRLHHHLLRLRQSLAEIGISHALTDTAWKEMIHQLVAQKPGTDQYLYCQITRGVAPRDHSFPENIRPTVFAYSQPLTAPDEATLKKGGTAITCPDIRWARCDIKATALLANVLLRQQAVSQGATEAILVRDGNITEGAASNMFAVVDNRLLTAPKGPLILPGITRDLIVELASAHQLALTERAFTVAELERASEVWMTSSTKEILPILKVDGRVVGTGSPGPVFWRMHALFQEYKNRFRKGEVD